MSYAIITDTTSDLTLDEAKAMDVTMVPLSISFKGQVLRDQYDMTNDEFYKLMASGDEFPKTSQPAPQAFADAFQKAADDGCDGVLCIVISTGLSGTLEAATVAAENSPIPVEIIDSFRASVGLALYVDYAVDLRKQGKTLKEAADIIRDAVANNKVELYFAVGCLDQLYAGGRLSKKEYTLANLLNIWPLLTFDDKGGLTSFSKTRGAKGVSKYFAKKLEENKENILYWRILHTKEPTVVEGTQKLAVDIEGLKPVLGVNLCGATIASHLGEHAAGISFLLR